MLERVRDSSPRWHALAIPDVLDAADTAADTGLTPEQAAARLAEHGPNRLPPPQRRGPWLRFLAQFHNLLIYVLLGSAVLTLALQEYVDAGVIFGVVLANALIGFLQEGKAERALDAIRGMLAPNAVVVRGGRRHTVPVEELVPGDVVVLTSGDRVPADLRLVTVKGLRVQEAALTGESVPVEKTAEEVAPDAALADRSCMAYSGTLVAGGHATGVVVATGARTELGRISEMLSEVTTLQTPLLQQMARFGRWLTAAILMLAAATFAWGVAVWGYGATDMFLAVVGLAVAAIPEGLPAIMTITLAIGVQRMAARNAIIRRLPAVETLGSVTVICSDKTGTLTRNEMVVRNLATAEGIFSVTGEGYVPAGDLCDGAGNVVAPAAAGADLAGRGAVLCNEADLWEKDGDWVISGDPMEAALLAFAGKVGQAPEDVRAAWRRVDVIPFESEHKFMATLHHDHSGHGCCIVKGAPDVLLARCTRQRAADGSDQPLDAAAWQAHLHDLAGRGERLLALALKTLPAGTTELRFDDVAGDLTLVCVFGLIDPPRPEAIEAIGHVDAAGIEVKMITGDHAITAAAIGAQLGLRVGDGTAVSGTALDTLDDAAFARTAQEAAVFARTTPEHKLRLVEALQSAGHVVCMTGDGVNDAPALKRADVGVAMGNKGTEAAKEAAEMVLADDNFASIAAAVEEGRTVYDNLKKAILFILPTNGGEAFVIMLAILFGLTLPMTPKQILWVNMITAVTLALAVAFEPPEARLMRRPPRRRDEPLLSRFLVWRIVYVSALLVAGTVTLFQWTLESSGDVALARTVAVNTLVAGEVFYLWNVRRLWDGVLTRDGLFGSRAVLTAMALVIGFQLVFTYAPPFQFLFDTRPLDLAQWAAVTVFGLCLLLLVELEKWVAARLTGRRRGVTP